MLWKIYKDRNGWMTGDVVGEAETKIAAKAKAWAMRASHISNGNQTYYFTPSTGRWHLA